MFVVFSFVYPIIVVSLLLFCCSIIFEQQNLFHSNKIIYSYGDKEKGNGKHKERTGKIWKNRSKLTPSTDSK